MAFTEEELQEMFGEDPETLKAMRDINSHMAETESMVKIREGHEQAEHDVAEYIARKEALGEAIDVDEFLREIAADEDATNKLLREQRAAAAVLPFEKRK